MREGENIRTILIIQTSKLSIRDDGSLGQGESEGFARELFAFAISPVEIDSRKTALSVPIVRENPCFPAGRQGIENERGKLKGSATKKRGKRSVDVAGNALQPLLFKLPRGTVVVISFLSAFRDHRDPRSCFRGKKPERGENGDTIVSRIRGEGFCAAVFFCRIDV